MVDDIDEYDGFKLALEMLKFNMSDRQGKPRKYTKGYIMFALTMRSALGLSKYSKIRRLNYIPLPCRKTVDSYMRNNPESPHPTTIDVQTMELLVEVLLLLYMTLYYIVYLHLYFLL